MRRSQASEERLRQAVLTLWQTSMLRRNKLTVLDEVTNGLSYYDYTFLREVPRLHCALQDDLQAADPADRAVELASFLRIGSWIGRDRDGNPFVTARGAGRDVAHAETRACRFYLDELHELGAELSLGSTIVGVSRELQGLAGRSPDRSPHRREEPYRLAISGIYARVAATARDARSLRGGKTSRRRGASLSERGRISGRAANSRPVAVGEWITRARARAAPQPAAGHRLLRLSLGERRPATEFRRPRADDRRARGGGGARDALPCASGDDAHRRSCTRTHHSAGARVSVRRLIPRRRMRS